MEEVEMMDSEDHDLANAPSVMVANLSTGILNSCDAELASVSKELKDFTRIVFQFHLTPFCYEARRGQATTACPVGARFTGCKDDQQSALLKKMSRYNARSDSSHIFLQVKDAMDLISAQMDRLTGVKTDMSVIQERSKKLRVRAEKLRSRIEDKERRDEDLVAQLVGSGDHQKQTDGNKGQRGRDPIVGVETKVELGL